MSAQVDARAYAHQLVLARWHSEAEWRALEAIVRPESGWDPCAVYPSRHNCRYAGSNSCGLGQRNPCPGWMRGRLWETRLAQVRDLLSYVERRYGSPSRALQFRRRNGWF